MALRTLKEEILVDQGESCPGRDKDQRRVELKKVQDDKEALRRQLAELELKEKTLTEAVQGENVYDTLQERRLTRKPSTGTPISTMLEEDREA
jgi:hypothetical protein